MHILTNFLQQDKNNIYEHIILAYLNLSTLRFKQTAKKITVEQINIY
jgi:hypothetical protein